MRTFKNVLLYLCDLLQVLLIKLPLNLVKTNRGRVALVIFVAMAVFSTGWYFWNSVEIYQVKSPDAVEKIIADKSSNYPIALSSAEINYYQTTFYDSPECFLAALDPKESISVTYYAEWIKHISTTKVSYNLVKVYQGRANGKTIIYRAPFDNLPPGFKITNYALDFLIVESNDRTNAFFVWSFGGLFWLIILYIVVIYYWWEE